MRVVAWLAIILVAGFIVPPAHAEADTKPVLLAEIQTASADSASDEFVELYNPNDQALDLSGWMLEYLSAAGTSWLTKHEFSAAIEPRGRFLLASTGYLEDATEYHFASGLAAAGGHLRLVEPQEGGADQVYDLVGWGTALQPETTAALAPPAGKSLKRLVDEEGEPKDTNDNSKDFFVSDSPTPEHTLPVEAEEPESEEEEQLPPFEPVESPSDELERAPEEPEGEPVATSANVEITELFIDPVAPQTDADDEFVELYNNSSEAVTLNGYKIVTGNNSTYDYLVDDITLDPHQYYALYARDTDLVLSNSGGRARLLAENGGVTSETPPYEKSPPGQSWALNESGTWQWTAKPTPGQPNVMAVSLGTSTTTKKSTKVASTKKAAKPKSSAKAKKSSNPKTSKQSSASERTVFEEPATAGEEPINNLALVAGGGVAVLYAGWEYRHDIANRIRQLRNYLTSRRGTRP